MAPVHDLYLGDSSAAASDSSTPRGSEPDVLDALHVLHGQFESGEVSFGEFEARKAQRLSRFSALTPRS
jgi:hypothetical protein